MVDRAQITSAVSGIIALVTFFIMGGMGGFLPPLPPLTPAVEVAQFYKSHAYTIQLAIIIQMCSLSLLAVFYAGISAVIRDIEKDRTPTWSYLSLALGVFGLAPLFCATAFWAVAAFRPERAPEIVLAMHDAAVFLFLAPAPPATVLLAIIGFAIVGDKRPVKVFPTWLGYYSFVAAAVTLPGSLVVMAKTGTFAWNGWWGNLAPLTGFILWSFIAQYYMIRGALKKA